MISVLGRIQRILETLWRILTGSWDQDRMDSHQKLLSWDFLTFTFDSLCFLSLLFTFLNFIFLLTSVSVILLKWYTYSYILLYYITKYILLFLSKKIREIAKENWGWGGRCSGQQTFSKRLPYTKYYTRKQWGHNNY